MLEFSHSFCLSRELRATFFSLFLTIFSLAVVVLKVLYFQQVAHHVMALPPYSKVQTSGGQVPGLEGLESEVLVLVHKNAGLAAVTNDG